MSKNISVFGILPNRGRLESAIDSLRTHGFRAVDISVLLPENAGNKDLGVEKSNKSPEGAATGAASAAVVAGTLGWLAGIGMIAIPGIGPLIAAGPLVAALAGVGAGAALGGVTGALIGLGFPEYEAKRYEGRVKAGGILVSVHCDSNEWAKRATSVLEDQGAEAIAQTGEAPADFLTTEIPVRR